MLALWLPLAAGVGFLRAGCGCSSCLALHPAVLGRTGENAVCVGAEEKCDADCAKCTAASAGGICTAPSLLQEHTRSRCPPPQPCTCNCNCPEIVYPVPPPLPLLPTPLPGLLQTGAQTVNMQTGAVAVPSFVQTAAHVVNAQPVPGMALPPPGAPINMLPPPPMPPLPPMPPDPRVQECPVTPPCTCYCHCKQPPAANTQPLFVPPTQPPTAPPAGPAPVAAAAAPMMVSPPPTPSWAKAHDPSAPCEPLQWSNPHGDPRLP